MRVAGRAVANAPRGYRKETREVFVKKNADFSDSQKHDGLKSGLARDRKTNDLSHVVIGDPVESGSDRTRRSPNTERERVPEVVSDSAPDISGLVPLALVAVAGIAVGAAGIKAAQNAKKKRRAAQAEPWSVGSVSTAPAGWYEVEGGPTLLRYWSGFAWTNDYAQRAVSAPRIAADWYPDPSNAAQLRYWDGSAWTHHVSPAPGVVTTPADWYSDPSNPAQLRYWDGSAWTSHVTNGAGTAVAPQPATARAFDRGLAPAHAEPKVNMSSAEWKAHVEAWLRVGAIQQELWRRLSHAHLQDADDATLEAQRRMEALTPEEGARRIKLMLEASPVLREQGSLVDLMRLISGVPEGHLGIEATRGAMAHPESDTFRR
jgi:hypothetical protein